MTLKDKIKHEEKMIIAFGKNWKELLPKKGSKEANRILKLSGLPIK